MIAMYGSMDNTWSVERKSFWVTVVDLTLPLAPVFWGLADLAALSIASLAVHGRVRPARG
jgi:hypothetical protein